MKVELIAKTDPGSQSYTEFLASVARRCYSVESFSAIKEKLSYDKAKEVLKKIIESEHLSILEHVSFTFSITGIPVYAMGQLTRHRLSSFAVTSLRYNNLKKKGVKFVETNLKEEDGAIVEYQFEKCVEIYNHLIDIGYRPEKARVILPQGVLTNVIMTMNMRELFHFLELRNCAKADDCIHSLAKMILDILDQEDSFIFTFVKHSCLDCRKCEKN